MTYFLEVTFDGLTAWVPEHDSAGRLKRYCVLWPDARFAERAIWGRPDSDAKPSLREPHQALLIVDDAAIGMPRLTPDAVVQNKASRWKAQALYLLKYRRVTFEGLAAAPAVKEPLSFQVAAGQWGFDTLPHMAEIAPRHRSVRGGLRPDALKLKHEKRGLAGSLVIDRGNLSVGRLFNNGEPLVFAHVKNRHGELVTGREIRKRPVGNQVIWRAPLVDKTVTVVLSKRGGDNSIVVEADQATGVARVQLANAEMEGPVLGREDPFDPPEGKERFPDPDFGIYYRLSTSNRKRGRRVVVRKGTPIGSKEKPCAPAVFAGFGRDPQLELASDTADDASDAADAPDATADQPVGAEVRRPDLTQEETLEAGMDPELCREVCRHIESRRWLHGVAFVNRKLLLFVDPGSEPFVRELAVKLGVGRQRIETRIGSFRTLVPPALSPGSACEPGRPTLFPGSEITPVGGRRGILSCFVQDEAGVPYGLTVEHLFAKRAVDICNDVGKAGTWEKDGTLASSPGPADCAIFKLQAGSRRTTELGAAKPVGTKDLQRIGGAAVRRASDPLRVARVECVHACVKYEIDVVVDGTPARPTVTVTDQILLFDETGSFAAESDSGALVLMNQGAGGFQALAPMGICTAVFSSGKVFVASPLAACFERLGVTYLPSP